MNANARLLIAALRSGQYKQGFGVLKRKDCFCPLGVGCDLYIKNGGKSLIGDEGGGAVSFDGQTCGLPRQVMRWLGLRTKFGEFEGPSAAARERLIFSAADASCITDLNDLCRWTFAQIADFMESEPPGLFVEEAQRA